MNDTDIIDYKCTECDKDCHVQHIRYKYKKQFLCKSCAMKGKNTIVVPDGYHRLCYILRGMKARCYNPKRKDYPRYGGLGVTICKEWLEDKNNFVNWALENGYKDTLQIDKDKLSIELGIKPHRYSPETCRWITASENIQTIEKTNRNTSGFIGVTEYKRKHGVKFKAELTVLGDSIFLGYFDTALEGAIIRDRFIVSNGLKHTLNGVL